MILREHRIQCGGVGTFNLHPIGDLQFGADGFQENLWRDCVESVVSDRNALTIGMGDYSDHWRPTNQAKLAGITAFDKEFQDSIDDLYRKHNEKIYEKVKKVFVKGKCLGLHSGHHEHRYASGITSTQELCEWLGVPYLGEMGFTRIVFESPGKAHVWSLKVHSQHGEGGATFINSDVPNLERKVIPYWNADLYLRGHSTKKWAAPIPFLDMSKKNPPRLIEKTRWIVNTGGFCGGFLEGKSTYVSRRNMAPASLGYVIVHIKIGRRNSDYDNTTSEINMSVTL